jgi:sulfur-oxidizing protein SoxZ
MAEPKARVKIPKQVKRGEPFLVKTLISHKMETGFRKNKATGEEIPREIINKFVATFNGEEVFRADWHPAVSANPYMTFYMSATESGELEFLWVDDNGNEYTKTATVNVV